MAWRNGDLDGEPTVVVRHSGARVEIALAGATVLRWSVAMPDGGSVELGAGYASAGQLERNLEAAFAVMAPFVNRIREGRYVFAGEEHDLTTSRQPLDSEVIHGLVRRVRWRLLGVEEDDDAAHIALSAAIAPEEHPGYPYAVELQATFVLRAGSLALTLRATNVGTTAAPVVLGWHPYLALPGHETIDELTLSVPADTRVVVDDDLLPLPGAEAYQTQADGDARFTPLHGTRLDTSFLLTRARGAVSTWLRSPLTGHGIEVRQFPAQAPVMHVFTADTLAGRERTMVALEPVGAIADAFNRPEWADRIRLEPGETRELDVELVHHPDS